MTNYLIDCGLEKCSDINDVDETSSTMKFEIFAAMDYYIPKMRLRRKQFPVWFTPELRHAYKSTECLRRKYAKHPSPSREEKLSH